MNKETEENKPKEKSKTSIKEIFRKIIFFISLCVFLVSGYKLFLIAKDTIQNYNYYKEIQQYAPERVEENDGYVHYVMSNGNFDHLKGINEGFKGWITLENTRVNYPILQGDDNIYYLTQSLNHTKVNGGSIFLASGLQKPFEGDRNTIIHGHHMKNGSMFGTLKKYKKEDFFNNNKIIYISTRDKTYEYEIFSVYIELVSSAPYKNSFADDNEYIDYLNKLKDKSMYTNDDITSFSKDDKIITLSTCSYEFKDARMLIHGRLVKR